MTDWRDKAACKGEDMERFFTENQTDIRWALDMCAACPVKAECLEDDLAQENRHGIRGGMTASARARLLRRRA